MAVEHALRFVEPCPPPPVPLLEPSATLRRGPRFFEACQSRTLEALCNRVLPQPSAHHAVPLAALLDARCFAGVDAADPELGTPRECWRTALAAIDAEALARYGRNFCNLRGGEQDALLGAMRQGLLTHPAWQGLSCQRFFAVRLLRDISTAYYSHPAAWPSSGLIGSFAFTAQPRQE
ncbi:MULTISPECIES: gluconate 2-dehydrogenase subunit 3 family protein [unclassified Pseudomonas]|uniref:gluconate 2-dehydrogenase subunit 3 family protein n=1 Tax=unclassified Pseudomonas TaxID=196821 RepID=UPI000BDADA81|nr:MULTISPECIES: gluconate 2-dehydrogenase subunit 3 family protein [unclassified Pseudomonas]PVZ13922.1 gluconate 2-dehydrogenase subunit 3-like protein [Pseudomonas sp. URIL14HWK12:I12]PVZ24228.1 gluconate 2-dehydrogenase subunit 3-like protein [Pseudomonas sp. URIL14HWK12:I10]PVZ33133.1 gluconate 2-dehydrogenase subunit 3-like protein [Pseudomonas sp. URIL14HWK12:I11]SNZ10484.1 Gluconate 2-dehydrogenase subunit 3 [Pseudomonas sp. URIL14HWK12:I9]